MPFSDNSVTVEDESDDQTAGNAVDLGIKIGNTASADGMNVFKPTKDWQVIQPGRNSKVHFFVIFSAILQHTDHTG